MINNKKPIPEDAVKPPSIEDVEFIEFKWMKMSDVEKTLDRKLNVRTQDIDHQNVLTWRKAIENETYKHFAFFPPVYDLTVNRLISGHHKYAAHKLTRQEFLFCAIVKSDDVGASDRYASICNKPLDEEYIINPRSANDIISDVKKELARQNFSRDNPPTENKIHDILKLLKVDNKEVNKSHVVREVKKDLEVTESLNTYSIQEAREYVEDTFGDKEITKGPKENVTVKTYTDDKDSPWKDDFIWLINALHHRHEQNNSKLPIRRYISFQDVKDVDVARTNKNKSLQTMINKLKIAAEQLTHPDFTMPEFIPLPQKDNE